MAEKLSGEIVDVTNPWGDPTGVRLDKTVVHNEGLWHRDVHVWITDGVHMLEQLRLPDKKIMPDTWDVSAAEHVQAGETYLDAAVRGVSEELGLAYEPSRFTQLGMLPLEMAMQDGAWMHRTAGGNFVVVDRELSLDKVCIQREEVADVRLYPIQQLIDDLSYPDTAARHAPQPMALWHLGITGMLKQVSM